MAFIPVQDNEFPDQQELLSPGMHIVKCVAVHDMQPSRKVLNGKPRLRFEFQGFDAATKQLTGKMAVYVCTASVFMGNGKIPESNLVTLARQAGYPNPEKGIDTQWFINRWFLAEVRQYENRAFVEKVHAIDESRGKTAKDREKWVKDQIAEYAKRQPSADLLENPPF